LGVVEFQYLPRVTTVCVVGQAGGSRGQMEFSAFKEANDASCHEKVAFPTYSEVIWITELDSRFPVF
jgi:hypothetical protein